MKKALFVLIAVAMVCFMATSAMAFQVTNRSTEMIENTWCDQAGTIKMSFEQTDWETIRDYLQNNDYAEIRITLTGTDLDMDEEKPFLCEDIKGSATSFVVPHSGELVVLDTTYDGPGGPGADEWEISDIDGNSAPDFTAYVWGEAGDPVGRIVHIYITDLADIAPDFSSNPPWFRLGLYQELIDNDDDPTSICVNAKDFDRFNKLTISNETNPQGLIFTGDNEIGHFGPQKFDFRECDKDELAECDNDTTIELCTEDDPGPNVVTQCPTYYKCFVVEGDFPAGGDFEIQVSTSTPGVYLYDINADINDGSDWDYYLSGCTIDADSGGCEWEAKCAQSDVLDLNDISSRDELVFCIAYNVNADEAIAGDVVEFEVSASTIPCGALFSGTVTAANLVACQGMEDCMYFPYVLTGSQPWSTGIVVTNLASDSIPAEDMEVTFVLTDANGDTYTEDVDNFTTVVWSGNLDSQLAAWGWAPAAGNAWLQVIANFPVDGYCYLTNGQFGAGTLPRENCCTP